MQNLFERNRPDVSAACMLDIEFLEILNNSVNFMRNKMRIIAGGTEK